LQDLIAGHVVLRISRSRRLPCRLPDRLAGGLGRAAEQPGDGSPVRPPDHPRRQPADLVKTTIFYTNVDDFPKLNPVYAQHMPDPPPARSAPANVELPRGLLIWIDAIAVIPSEGDEKPASP
jgi:Endoribonuclease L-PSP